MCSGETSRLAASIITTMNAPVTGKTMKNMLSILNIGPSKGHIVCRALQDAGNLPCPALPCQGRAGQGTKTTGQGRIRLQKILKGRLQGVRVVTC